MLACHGILAGHTEITHFRTCLDHMMIKSKREATCLILDTSITDHQPVALSLNLRSELIFSSKLVSHVNFKNLDHLVQQIDFDSILKCKDPNTAANMLVGKLSTAIMESSAIRKTDNSHADPG